MFRRARQRQLAGSTGPSGKPGACARLYPDSSLNRYSLLLITSMLLVGSNVGIGKLIVEFVPVPLFALLRFVIAMAVLWPLLRASKLRRVKRDEWFNLFLQALFGTFGLRC